jgi:chaperonin GroES
MPRAVRDKVIIRPDEPESKYDGSKLVIPAQYRDKLSEGIRRGRVVAVGEGLLKPDGSRVHIDVKPRDEIWYWAPGGWEIEVNGEKLYVVRAECVRGIVE